MSKNKKIKRKTFMSKSVQLADSIKWWSKDGNGSFNTDLYIRYCLAKKARE
jgi:hypothetical protein|tara:strand:+ start:87 stop:239 length:153 start_codon:yes stop_codon:yes gene_type:complete